MRKGTSVPDVVGSLYVHVPFCTVRCDYCDFASEPVAGHLRAGRVATYFQRLRQEIQSAEHVLAQPLETVYVGGGTPTAVPPALLNDLLEAFGVFIGPETEFTVEANPETLVESTLDAFRERRVTRLSLGVQSFSPEALRSLGRRVSPGAADRAVELLRRSAWHEWSIDLVFGIPGQDLTAFEADVAEAVAVGAPHISVYDLSYTADYARCLERRLGPAARGEAEALAEEHYPRVSEILTGAGYHRYEVSSYCRPGHESRHNQAYWRGADYLGVGASAVSTVGLRRWANPKGVAAYLACEPPEEDRLTPAIKRYERVMLGLRTAAGVPWSLADEAVDHEAVERLIGLGLLEKRCATLLSSPRGLDLGNAVLAAVLRSPE